MNKIEEIKKLASLLKEGAITQKEFDSLKRNLLVTTDNSSAPTSEFLKEKMIKEEIPKDEFAKREARKKLKKMDVAYAIENLIYCSYNGEIETVELLLIAGLNPNKFSINEKKRKCYAINNAAIGGHIDVIKLLLKYGAKINFQDEYGYTAIFFAIENGRIDAVRVLIDNGADLNIKTIEGANPHYWAKKFNKYEMLDILKRSGAKELSDNEITAIKSSMFLKWVKLAGAFLVLCLLVGYCVSNVSSPSSNSNSSSTLPSFFCS